MAPPGPTGHLWYVNSVYGLTDHPSSCSPSYWIRRSGSSFEGTYTVAANTSSKVPASKARIAMCEPERTNCIEGMACWAKADSLGRFGFSSVSMFALCSSKCSALSSAELSSSWAAVLNVRAEARLPNGVSSLPPKKPTIRRSVESARCTRGGMSSMREVSVAVGFVTRLATVMCAGTPSGCEYVNVVAFVSSWAWLSRSSDCPITLEGKRLRSCTGNAAADAAVFTM
mmetsp:Transcript_51377/g.143629  ORF Transcript_51377/g.143629 Transcript_51377/m.143629 type:complete len:228 (-) Transcript_51377:491-1174(-)